MSLLCMSSRSVTGRSVRKDRVQGRLSCRTAKMRLCWTWKSSVVKSRSRRTKSWVGSYNSAVIWSQACVTIHSLSSRWLKVRAKSWTISCQSFWKAYFTRTLRIYFFNPSSKATQCRMCRACWRLSVRTSSATGSHTTCHFLRSSAAASIMQWRNW